MEGQSPQVQDTVFSYLFSLLLLISPFPSLTVILQNKILPFLVPLFPQLHLLALSHIGLVATNYQANIPDAQLQLSQCWMIWITVKSRPQHGFFFWLSMALQLLPIWLKLPTLNTRHISFLSLSGYTEYFPLFLHVCVHRNVFLIIQTQSWMLSFYPAWKMYLFYFYSNFYFSGFWDRV